MVEGRHVSYRQCWDIFHPVSLTGCGPQFVSRNILELDGKAVLIL